MYDLDRHMPRATPNRVTLRLTNGEERGAAVIESLGSPEQPPCRARLPSDRDYHSLMFS